jgi:hypothetical protein
MLVLSDASLKRERRQAGARRRKLARALLRECSEKMPPLAQVPGRRGAFLTCCQKLAMDGDEDARPCVGPACGPLLFRPRPLLPRGDSSHLGGKGPLSRLINVSGVRPEKNRVS